MLSSVFYQENYRMGGKFTWPRLSEVANYRSKVKTAILKIIDDTPLDLPITKDSPWVSSLNCIRKTKLKMHSFATLYIWFPLIRTKLTRIHTKALEGLTFSVKSRCWQNISVGSCRKSKYICIYIYNMLFQSEVYFEIKTHTYPMFRKI